LKYSEAGFLANFSTHFYFLMEAAIQAWRWGSNDRIWLD